MNDIDILIQVDESILRVLIDQTFDDPDPECQNTIDGHRCRYHWGVSEILRCSLVRWAIDRRRSCVECEALLCSL